jgi:hypothetical protein
MRYAVLRMAVPVDRFEDTLQRVRDAAKEVLSEGTSGVDVSAEFVDVQSQIANLEATQARVREFLTQATTVEEALQVNARLTEIEGQLSQLKGRLQFLSQRAAFSTITVELRQPLVATTPAGLPAWNPGKIASDAYTTLATVVQALATVVIWVAIVVLPIAVPFIFIGYLVARFRRRPAAQK